MNSLQASGAAGMEQFAVNRVTIVTRGEKWMVGEWGKEEVGLLKSRWGSEVG